MQKKKKIDPSIISIAGEFAVATELCRRNIYAQLTLGNQKRVDLLTMSREGKFLRIEVKAKQTPMWPNIKGISIADAFLVFVDFANKGEMDRPDFFVLSFDDWRAVAAQSIEEYRLKHPDRKPPYLDVESYVVNPAEKNHRGCTLSVSVLERYRETWSKIIDAGARVDQRNVKLAGQ